jgi:hypothetical protein
MKTLIGTAYHLALIIDTPMQLFFLNNLKSTCDVNLLSKLSIIFKEWRVINNVDRAELLFSLYFRYYAQTFFVTRLIINKINQVQWVDFKLENVLVSLHSLKTMDLAPFGASAPLFLRNGELLGHSPIHRLSVDNKLAIDKLLFWSPTKIIDFVRYLRLIIVLEVSAMI